MCESQDYVRWVEYVWWLASKSKTVETLVTWKEKSDKVGLWIQMLCEGLMFRFTTVHIPFPLLRMLGMWASVTASLPPLLAKCGEGGGMEVQCYFSVHNRSCHGWATPSQSCHPSVLSTTSFNHSISWRLEDKIRVWEHNPSRPPPSRHKSLVLT